MARRIANAMAIAIGPAMASGWHPEMAHSTPLLSTTRAGSAFGSVMEMDFKLKSVTREGCWPKAGWLSGEVYCGRHGRAASWPCRAGD